MKQFSTQLIFFVVSVFLLTSCSQDLVEPENKDQIHLEQKEKLLELKEFRKAEVTSVSLDHL